MDTETNRLFIKKVSEINTALSPKAAVDTYGCQQNESDSERIKGALIEMGYALTDSEAEADVVVVNTCAVREHAEQRALGNIGALTHTKRANKNQIIIICGCMTQQDHIAEKIKKSYPYVTAVLGTDAPIRLAETLYRCLTEKKRVFDVRPPMDDIPEGLPVFRESGVKAWIPIMYGCENFCSYCVVPYVRGKERSRPPEKILEEARGLIESGCRDITLLGQNVNSYRGAGDTDFPELFSMVCSLEGDFLVRFMTSHPKDATKRLIDAMASSPRAARHLHLPVQSGSDRVLSLMNRKYTSASYEELIRYAREKMPDITVTSDIIVGFPGETEEDFSQTLNLCDSVGFDAIFAFIYSKREGTPAASMPDDVSREEKGARFDRLMALQNAVSAGKHASLVGTRARVLIDGPGGNDEYPLSGRTGGGRLVHISGDAAVGSFREVEITSATSWTLSGRVL